jgi:hypothetical protein
VSSQASCTPASTSREYPVFLPMQPTQAARLLTVPLCAGVQLVLLCGDEPSLQRAESLAREHFAPAALGALERARQREQPRWMDHVPVPPSVVACIVVR